MLYVSFVELLPEAFIEVGEIIGLYAFFAGIIVIGIIDVLIPEAENPHAFKGLETKERLKKGEKEFLAEYLDKYRPSGNLILDV